METDTVQVHHRVAPDCAKNPPTKGCERSAPIRTSAMSRRVHAQRVIATRHWSFREPSRAAQSSQPSAQNQGKRGVGPTKVSCVRVDTEELLARIPQAQDRLRSIDSREVKALALEIARQYYLRNGARIIANSPRSHAGKADLLVHEANDHELGTLVVVDICVRRGSYFGRRPYLSHAKRARLRAMGEASLARWKAAQGAAQEQVDPSERHADQRGDAPLPQFRADSLIIYIDRMCAELLVHVGIDLADDDPRPAGLANATVRAC